MLSICKQAKDLQINVLGKHEVGDTGNKGHEENFITCIFNKKS